MRRREFLRWVGAAGVAAGMDPLGAGILSGPLGTRVSAAEPSVPTGAGAPIARLDSNENPYGPAASARRAIIEAIVDGNRYPDPARDDLIATLASRHDLGRDQVLPGCGSTELLRAAVSAFAAGGRMVMADPTYEDPVDYAGPFDVSIVRVPLDDEARHDLPAMARAVQGGARLVYVCNPNNPTGTIVDREALEPFVRSVAPHATVLVDEAYHDYVADSRYRSMVPLVREGLPIVVTRTFSKIHGLAGLRLGYALGGKEQLERMKAFVNFSATNVLAVRAALASLEDREFLERCRAENARARAHLTASLEKRGYPVFDSQANFVMFRLGSDARRLIADLASAGVRIGRPFPPLTEHCRVSLGTQKELDGFLDAFDRWRGSAAA